MTKDKSLEILNICLKEIENMSQEEFDKRDKEKETEYDTWIESQRQITKKHIDRFEKGLPNKNYEHTKLNEIERMIFERDNHNKKYCCTHKFGELHDNINLGIVQECEKCGYIEKVDLKVEPVSFSEDILKALEEDYLPIEECEHDFVTDGGNCIHCGKPIWQLLEERVKGEIKMKELKDYTLDELEIEIKKRKTLPVDFSRLSQISFLHLQEACREYIDNLSELEDMSGFAHNIFEVAMELCYGEDIWKYINATREDK
jgi:hypothetical protein